MTSLLLKTGRSLALRRGIGKIIALFGTDPNRRLSEIMGSPADLTIERNEPSLLHGQYRIVLLRKQCKSDEAR